MLQVILNLWEINYLAVSAKKTQAIICRAKHKTLNLENILYLNNEEITILSEIKTLGVIFLESLLYNKHIELFCSKLKRIAGLLRMFCSLLCNELRVIDCFDLH